jgi:8-oxo-dGTP diphosphatase
MIKKVEILPVSPLTDIDPIVTKETIPSHFTASAIVSALGHILLVHHKKIGAWVPPGGHINQTEMPHEAAVREVYEETGVKVEVLSEQTPTTGDSKAFFPPQPLCIHTVEAFEDKAYVYHLDLAYLCKPISLGILLPKISYSQEVNEARWFTLEEVSDVTKITLAKNVPELIALAQTKMKLLNL